jgi:predicted small secreted protein
LATNDSQGLRKKTAIRLSTIALFAVGILIAGIAVLQQYLIESKPFAISHEEAVRIALVQVDKEPNRDAALLPNEEAGAKLIHVADGGIGYVVDEHSFEDMWLYSIDHRFFGVYENAYLWHVDVYTTTNEGDSRGYWYLIDADSGRVIGNDRDYAAFETS